MRKKIYEDILDDVEKIEPDVTEADGNRSYVTEPFSEEEYPLVFKIIPWFRSGCADLEVKLSLIASLIRDILSPDFKISPIFVDTEWFKVTEDSYAVMVSVGVIPAHRITVRRALRVLLSFDGIGRISIGRLASSVSMSDIPAKGRIHMYKSYGNAPAQIFDRDNRGDNVTALVREAAGAYGKDAADKLYLMYLAISGMSGSSAQRERFDEAVAAAAASLNR